MVIQLFNKHRGPHTLKDVIQKLTERFEYLENLLEICKQTWSYKHTDEYPRNLFSICLKSGLVNTLKVDGG